MTVHLNPAPADGREARRRVDVVAVDNGFKTYGGLGKPSRIRRDTDTHTYMIAADPS